MSHNIILPMDRPKRSTKGIKKPKIYLKHAILISFNFLNCLYWHLMYGYLLFISLYISFNRSVFIKNRSEKLKAHRGQWALGISEVGQHFKLHSLNKYTIIYFYKRLCYHHCFSNMWSSLSYISTFLNRVSINNNIFPSTTA